jgi:hypothetical protein
MATLKSWWEAQTWALENGYAELEAIDYADQHFPCPGCGEDECGAVCTAMLALLSAAIDHENAADLPVELGQVDDVDDAIPLAGRADELVTDVPGRDDRREHAELVAGRSVEAVAERHAAERTEARRV